MTQKVKDIKQKRSLIKRKTKAISSFTFSEEKLKADILTEAKKLRIADSTAEVITEKVVASVAKWAAKRTAVTIDDINRRVALEMAKYNGDLSYVYQNRGKII